jgi:prefoldin subunit 5
MITNKPQSKRTKHKPKPTKLMVGFDIFGNAVPDVASAQVEGTGKALRVVKRQEVTVKPGRKQKTKQSTALVAVKSGFLGRLIPWANQASQQPEAKVIKIQRAPAHDHETSGIAERLEYAFKRLHQEFNEREQQLEDRLQEIRQQHQQLTQAKQQQKSRWVLPVSIAAAAGGGYMLYVLTSMQNSMTAMSGNITAMNGHIGTMAGDTQAMSQNLQTMNNSVYYLNGNVANMNASVAQMNQQVGTLAQAAAPMGQAAQTMTPFMKMFKSIMPF